jgi:hypothetical protein
MAAPAQTQPEPAANGWVYSPPPPPRDNLQDEPPPPEAKGVHYHDGFYLRLGLGAGYLVSRGTGENDVEAGVSGVTIPVEFALGGTPARGLVVGGGAWGVHIPSAEYTAGRGDFVKSERADYGAISMIGPFMDGYVNPKQGFHVQGAACLTLVAPGQSDTIITSDFAGAGFGGMFGFGYEGWVGEQWGMGVLARAQYLSVTLEDEDGNKIDYNAFAPSLLLTATLH